MNDDFKLLGCLHIQVSPYRNNTGRYRHITTGRTYYTQSTNQKQPKKLTLVAVEKRQPHTVSMAWVSFDWQIGLRLKPQALYR